MAGHGGYSLYPPEYLLEHDVVLVTANYRLGPLGFLSTESKECPGNNGLKDQVMVLKWVRMNIPKFGGNSNSVTIFGESAGKSRISLTQVSAISQSFFRRSICELPHGVANVKRFVPTSDFAIRSADDAGR